MSLRPSKVRDSLCCAFLLCLLLFMLVGLGGWGRAIMPRSLGDGKSEGGSKPSTLEVCPPHLEWLHTPVHFHRMSEHETKENDATSMPREEYFKAFLEGVDFWHDLPVLFRLMEAATNSNTVLARHT